MRKIEEKMRKIKEKIEKKQRPSVKYFYLND